MTLSAWKAIVVALVLLGLWKRVEERSRTLQYLYFVRFSIALWLFPPLFALADMDAIRSLSRGIFVPEFLPSYVVVGFFLVTTGFVALVTARVTIIHGEERFRADRPSWMTRWFVNDQAQCENRPVLLSLIPAFLTSIYLAFDGVAEGVDIWRIVWGLVLGWGMAFAFWTLVNAWYYLSYRFKEPEDLHEIVRLGHNAARTILLPRWLFRLRRPGEEIVRKKTLEDIVTEVRPKSVEPPAEGASIGPKDGQETADAQQPVAERIPDSQHEPGRYSEAESFTFLSALGSLALYALLWPLTAPIPTGWCLVALLVELVILIIVLRIFLQGRFATTRPPESDEQKRREQRTLRFWKWVLSGFAVFFAVMLASVYLFSFGNRFPTLASVLLLVLVVLWLLSALAYWLDQYRVPVLTLFLLMGILPRAFHLYGSTEEHYISTSDARKDGPQLETPAQIVADKLRRNGNSVDRPYIIITATGGGLHASAWTALLLKQLNDRLSTSGDAQSFWDHVILMSTVSGSSLTLSYYLHHLESTKGKIGKAEFDQIVQSSNCSSLEAVGWGLAYYDLPRAILPLAPQILLPHSPGTGDLTEMPYFKDRTWALRRAIERNQDDKYCQLVQRDDENRTHHKLDLHHKLNLSSPQFDMFNWRELLRERLWPRTKPLTDPLSLAKLGNFATYPAFTMNTTTAEAGDRFLLANYRLPDYDLGKIEGPGAESFLNLFPRGQGADLPLSTAAQMSATFPYVSSAARIPERYTPNGRSVHFVDGGYYDNDGTASAIEFLRYALDAPETDLTDDAEKSDAAQVAALRDVLDKANGTGTLKKLKILLIEIRNSTDEDPRKKPDTAKAFRPVAKETDKYSASDALDQLTKPLDAFWSAGHESVTSRDRNGLDLLLQSHSDRVVLHQIVFDDQTKSTSKFGIKAAEDPLSWSLTPQERSDIQTDSLRIQPCIEDAFQHFAPGDWQSVTFRCGAPDAPQSISKLTP